MIKVLIERDIAEGLEVPYEEVARRVDVVVPHVDPEEGDALVAGRLVHLLQL